MAFKYLVFSLDDNSVEGTDDEKIALEYSDVENFIVVSTLQGMWLTSGDEVKIEELKA
jgi:hypothetical protein